MIKIFCHIGPFEIISLAGIKKKKKIQFKSNMLTRTLMAGTTPRFYISGFRIFEVLILLCPYNRSDRSEE